MEKLFDFFPKNIQKMLEEEQEKLLRWKKICLTLPVPELLVRLRRPNLPDKEQVELVLRYETTFNRQFYSALDQLERLQRQRRGKLR